MQDYNSDEFPINSAQPEVHRQDPQDQQKTEVNYIIKFYNTSNHVPKK